MKVGKNKKIVAGSKYTVMVEKEEVVLEGELMGMPDYYTSIEKSPNDETERFYIKKRHGKNSSSRVLGCAVWQAKQFLEDFNKAMRENNND